MRTSHLEIRRKILDEKMKITNEELFGSPAFAAYLTDIGESVTKRYGRPFKVKTYWDPKPGADVAWTDNRVITINTGNQVSMSFPTRETKATSEVGLLAHEVGHINYTDFRALRTYQRALLQGRFYPKNLKGLSCDEENAVEELRQYAADGDQVALGVVLKVAHTLCNLVEDAYIEERVPGLSREAAHRHSDQSPENERAEQERHRDDRPRAG